MYIYIYNIYIHIYIYLHINPFFHNLGLITYLLGSPFFGFDQINLRQSLSFSGLQALSSWPSQPHRSIVYHLMVIFHWDSLGI